MQKRKRTHNYQIAVLLFFLVYVLLLAALVSAEKGQPGSQINSFGDAIWYSLATFSTVGYGDMTPVTAAGRVIGVIFLLMSMGLLVALFGSVVSVLASEGLPMMKLRFRRDRDWYYIADFNAEGDTFARDVIREDPDAVIIFGESKDKEAEKPDYPCMFINVSPARIVAHKKGRGNRCKLFFLKENDIGSNLRAVDVHALDADVYARTTSGQEKMSGNIFFFHTYDCCARSYWREHPLQSDEDVIVLIGFGRYGKALLKRAILTNICDDDFDVSYHIFGDPRRFREIHTNLDLAFGIDERRRSVDSIFFHEEPWTADHDIIKQADRIIICGDDEEAGWDDLWQMKRYYENKGGIYLRSNRPAPGIKYFGTNEQIYTVNQIIRSRLNDAARMMNDLYRRSVKDSLAWEELSDQLRESKIAVADHLFMKVRILLGDRTISVLDKETLLAASDAYKRIKDDPAQRDMLRRIEHSRWIRFYAYYNWKYGEARDDSLHENPMIRDYDSLTDDQKAYFDRAWELLEEIAENV